jgi:uncharacterized protein (DUF433 family)
MTTNKQLLDRIVQDPQIMVGKPVIRGTRIPVELVLGHLAHNFDLDEFFAAYPELTTEDVQACLAYAKTFVARTRPRRVHREMVFITPERH